MTYIFFNGDNINGSKLLTYNFGQRITSLKTYHTLHDDQTFLTNQTQPKKPIVDLHVINQVQNNNH